MYVVDKLEFEELINQVLNSFDSYHVKNIANVAILSDYEPNEDQRQALKLRNDQSLFGLYQGVPLASRQGQTIIYPDRITLFQGPLQQASTDRKSLIENIRHTLWHEIGHYYGLNHQQIAELEKH